MMKMALNISASIFLAGSAIAAPPPASLKTEIQAKVGASLRDEASALYRWPDFNPSSVVYCGFVNAKNAYGGYAGFSAYQVFVTGSAANGFKVGAPIIVRSVRDSLDDIMYNVVRESCAKAGIDISTVPRQ